MTDFTFRFAGREIPARAGDSIATALYRAGVRVFSRSFKYHRPRGLLCGVGRCANCLVQVGQTPNVRACVTPAEPDSEVQPQNVWPSLAVDLLALNDVFSFLLPPGFYYKTFIRPRSFWPLYEKVLRHAAGLGRIDIQHHPEERYEKSYRHPDLLVVGGGPAGLSAALAAAEAGLEVVLADEQPRLGGHTQWGPSSPTAVEGLITAVLAHRRIEVFRGAVAFGVYEGGMVPLMLGERMIGVRWRELIVATGCHEYPLVFPNNDRPGIMLASAARRLLRHGVRPGTRAVVVTTSPDGYALAADLSSHDVTVAAVVDSRPGNRDSEMLTQVLAARGITLLTGHGIVRGVGRSRVRAAIVAPLDESGHPVPAHQTLSCDLVVLAAGSTPDAALLRQAGCSVEIDETGETMLRELAPHVRAAGAVNGFHDLTEQMLDGQYAGMSAAIARGLAGPDLVERQRQALRTLEDHRHTARTILRNRPVPAVVKQSGGKAILCSCEDVTAADVAYAVAEGFDHPELLKRYLTVSMGPCQGKMCARVAGELCATATGIPLTQTSPTTSRPPYHPVPLGVLAGRPFELVQRSALHRKHEAAGATWMDAGTWKRPKSYGNVIEECRAVRERVGVIDVSTLGKLEVQGRDAGRLLERIYTHRFANLPVGRVRYAVASDDSGIVLDDGTVCRVAEDRFFVTTTTSGIGSMEAWLTSWCEGTGWCAHVTNLTSTYAAVNLAGPKSRDVLRRLTPLDLSPAALPYLAAAEASVAGIPTRLLRIGFVGELGYEMHFPADYGEAMWDALMEAGAEFGIRPFGVEAQRILRLEKGHLIVTQDTDALSTVLEADMAWAVKLDKDDFIGRRALESLSRRELRNRVVGFMVTRDDVMPFEGDQVVDDAGRPVGRVTSVRQSPTLQRTIGLAWMPAERAKVGLRFSIWTGGRPLTAEVVATPFYDPDGKRMKC